jgi:glutamine cyclotransferase
MKRLVAAAVISTLFFFLLSATLFFGWLNDNDQTVSPEIPHYTFKVINTYPHDPNAFTEGLVYLDGFLYESTGLKGASTLRRVDLPSGRVLEEISLDPEYFGEGLAIYNDTIVQLTWQSHLGFLYSKEHLSLVGNFSYPTEGWGLTFDGELLIMSNGSDYLRFLDPLTFQLIREVQVNDGNISIREINELEYVNGDIYANIFQQREIAIINPQTGKVKGWIDLSGLQGASGNDPEAVLNGIAFDAIHDRLFVTGKDWPNLYEIKLLPSSTKLSAQTWCLSRDQQ